MHAVVVAMSLLASTPSPSPVVISPQFLVGEWHSDKGRTFHFRANGAYWWHVADVSDEGQWRLRSGGHTVDLISEDQHGKTAHELIVIDRVVHETLYVHSNYQRETWLKQPGP
jgi:hypothetical protein